MIEIQQSTDDGRTWLTLSQYTRALALAKVKAGGRFLAWLTAGYTVELGGIDYRIAPKQEQDNNE